MEYGIKSLGGGNELLCSDNRCPLQIYILHLPSSEDLGEDLVLYTGGGNAIRLSARGPKPPYHGPVGHNCDPEGKLSFEKP